MSEASLFDRLGGAEMVDKIVDDLVDARSSMIARA